MSQEIRGPLESRSYFATIEKDPQVENTSLTKHEDTNEVFLYCKKLDLTVNKINMHALKNN